MSPLKVRPARRPDKKIVKIVATAPVQYSTDGMVLSIFDPGELYELPDYAAWNMERRGWAKILTEAEIETQDTTETTIDVKDLRTDKPKE